MHSPPYLPLSGLRGEYQKLKRSVAALKGGYINALVTDQDTAAEMLKLIGK
ncbi:Transcriptional regulator lsrR [Serratia fonticola]|uniref:Transcriptional regulator lsrR n=1 Tax=Serratia fonticola TaxID=47917 RepID=A0A4U9TCP8_SERFO|nr:Transcriptional regulator lsrR [Serratia fonticola]